MGPGCFLDWLLKNVLFGEIVLVGQVASFQVVRPKNTRLLVALQLSRVRHQAIVGAKCVGSRQSPGGRPRCGSHQQTAIRRPGVQTLSPPSGDSHRARGVRVGVRLLLLVLRDLARRHVIFSSPSGFTIDSVASRSGEIPVERGEGQVASRFVVDVVEVARHSSGKPIAHCLSQFLLAHVSCGTQLRYSSCS